MRRRAAFYVDALPIWLVYYGGDMDDGDIRRLGVRRIAARARADRGGRPRPLCAIPSRGLLTNYSSASDC